MLHKLITIVVDGLFLVTVTVLKMPFFVSVVAPGGNQDKVNKAEILLNNRDFQTSSWSVFVLLHMPVEGEKQLHSKEQ